MVPGRRPAGTTTRRGLHGRRGKDRVDQIDGGIGGLNAAAHHRRVVHLEVVAGAGDGQIGALHSLVHALNVLRVHPTWHHMVGEDVRETG